MPNGMELPPWVGQPANPMQAYAAGRQLQQERQRLSLQAQAQKAAQDYQQQQVEMDRQRMQVQNQVALQEASLRKQEFDQATAKAARQLKAMRSYQEEVTAARGDPQKIAAATFKYGVASGEPGTAFSAAARLMTPAKPAPSSLPGYLSPQQAARVKTLQARQAALEKRLELPEPDQKKFPAPYAQYQKDKLALDAISKELDQLEGAPPPATTPAAQPGVIKWTKDANGNPVPAGGQPSAAPVPTVSPQRPPALARPATPIAGAGTGANQPPAVAFPAGTTAQAPPSPPQIGFPQIQRFFQPKVQAQPINLGPGYDLSFLQPQQPKPAPVLPGQPLPLLSVPPPPQDNVPASAPDDR